MMMNEEPRGLSETAAEPTSGMDEKPSPYLLPGAVLLTGIMISASIIYTSGVAPRPVPGTANVAGAGEEAEADVKGNIVDDDPVLGNPSAPVTIVEFSDFQCPFCARLFQGTLPQIKENYINTGKVKFVYRDFPLTAIHPMAQKSAEGAECADEQGKFWEYHDTLFERQSELSLNNLKAWAVELGLNASQFNSCLDSGKYAAEVAKDLADGQELGVSGTPASFVNGRRIIGAVPYAQFETIIEEELKKIQ